MAESANQLLKENAGYEEIELSDGDVEGGTITRDGSPKEKRSPTSPIDRLKFSIPIDIYVGKEKIGGNVKILLFHENLDVKCTRIQADMEADNWAIRWDCQIKLDTVQAILTSKK